MFEALHLLTELSPTCLNGYPALKTFVTNFESRPQIAAYLASPRRVPLSPNEDGKQPNAGLARYTLKAPLDPRTNAEVWLPPHARK